ncbi:low affinity immunoglobulin epsilon Fc receptor-like [Mya arenaria]|uniref:low affinity immunoglobulin epsilon Fc receptor-like n=1 Tax=Mya arenaria TaxID=6604 RepID=UPI0022E2D050|nr:low affinity immunoglobulin epsilon Fc receptor-like [Mya arenaria]
MKSVYSLFILTFLIKAVLSSCPDGWLTHGQECYHFSHDAEPYLLARSACQLLKGSLVVIETAEENAFITSQIQNLQSGSYWMDLNDLQEEGSWLWQATGTAPEYTNWMPGEPNNTGNDENCALIYKGGKWNDGHCTTVSRYICEHTDESAQIVG